MKTFHVDATTKKEIMDEMVIALFIKEITEEVTDFYSEYYLGDIEVYNYEVPEKFQDYLVKPFR